MSENFSGRIAVITGAARGFGKAFAVALAERGAQVVLLDLDEKTVSESTEEINANGGKAIGRVCDVTDETQVGAIVAELVALFGGIDILINNAGLFVNEYSGPMSDMGLGKVRRLFDVNIMGVVTCTLAAQEAMSGREGAIIINISSTAATYSSTAYGVSKLAVRGLTVAFAKELGPKGIRVNAIAPGLIFTDTVNKTLAEEWKKFVLEEQIVKRQGEEQDIVNAMLYLASSRASFITGETLRVSGGSGLSP